MTISKENKKINVEFSQKINSSINSVWKAISEPGNLNNFHPFCKQNKVINWEKERSEDTIEYNNGSILHRKFKSWNEGLGYELIIEKNNIQFANVIWKVKSIQNNSCSISIQIELFYFIILNNYHKFLRQLIAKYFLKPIMKNYLKSVLFGLKFFVEENSIVQKNQFGKNRLFS